MSDQIEKEPQENVGLAVWCLIDSIVMMSDEEDVPIKDDRKELLRDNLIYNVDDDDEFNPAFLDVLEISDDDVYALIDYADQLFEEDQIFIEYEYYQEYADSVLGKKENRAKASELVAKLYSTFTDFAEDLREAFRHSNFRDFSVSSSNPVNTSATTEPRRPQSAFEAALAEALAKLSDEELDNTPMAEVIDRLSDEELRWKFDEWMEEYEPYLTRNARLQFAGKTFVFSGLDAHYQIRDNPIIIEVEKKGGIVRQSVSGKTDYLVVDPAKAGATKTNDAVAQINKGKNLQIILLDDLKKQLETNSVSLNSQPKPSSPSPSNKGTTPSSSNSVQSKQQKKRSGKTYVIEGGRLIAYTGNAFTPIIPKDATVIGSGVFDGNEDINCLEIPVTVSRIETGAFRNCPNLFRIIIPDYIIKIEKDAFINCPKLYIDTVPHSVAENYCKANGIQCKTDGLCAKLHGKP